jgi:uncharacterized membrane protein (DUF485 family)
MGLLFWISIIISLCLESWVPFLLYIGFIILIAFLNEYIDDLRKQYKNVLMALGED